MSRPLVQTFVARNSCGRSSSAATRSPTTDSLEPYIGELSITRLHCRTCGTALEGEFGVGRFGRLEREQLSFLESFLRARGNLKELERELGISYPTVRGRLETLLRALGLEEGAAGQVRPEERLVERDRDRQLVVGPDVGVAVLKTRDRDHPERRRKPGRHEPPIGQQPAQVPVAGGKQRDDLGGVVVECGQLRRLPSDLGVHLADALEERRTTHGVSLRCC